MNIIRFISTEYLKDNTAIQNNVDDELLKAYIIKAQDTEIQQTLGTNYYNHLRESIKNSSLTNDEETLLRTYIQPCLSEWAFYEVIPHLNYKATNKSIATNTSEFSSASTLEDIKYLRNSVRDMAEFYSKRLVRELSLNLNLYPLYASQSDNNLNKSNRASFGGLYLSKHKRTNLDSYTDPTNCCE